MFNKFYSVIVPSLAILAISCIGYAKEYRGISEYYVADLTTKEIAVNFARDKAKQNALEQAGTYVTSLSESTNGVLTKDDIHVVTLGVAKLKPKSEHINYTAPDHNGAVTLSYSAVFDIDEKEVEQNLNKYKADRTELKESKIRINNQQKFITTLSTKYIQLQKNFSGLNNKSAEKEYKVSIESIKNGQDASYYAETGRKYRNAKDFDNAIICYEKEIDSIKKTYNYADNTEMVVLPMIDIAMCYGSKGQYGNQEKTLNDALYFAKTNAMKAKVNGLLASFYSFEKYIPEKALEFANKAVFLEPNDESYRHRVFVFMSLGKWKDAIEDYNRIISNEEKLYSSVFAATSYYYLGDYKKTLELCDLAINGGVFQGDEDAKKLQFVVHQLRGKVYWEQKEFDNAIIEYTKCLELKPDNYEAYLERGCCYAVKDNLTLAYNDVMMSLTLNPNYELAKKVLERIEAEQKKRAGNSI